MPTNRKDISLDNLENTINHAAVSPDDEYIEKLDKLAAVKAFDALPASGKLTETQERRFRLHYFDGLSYRKIADREGVYPNAIKQSVSAVCEALKEYFEKF